MQKTQKQVAVSPPQKWPNESNQYPSLSSLMCFLPGLVAEIFSPTWANFELPNDEILELLVDWDGLQDIQRLLQCRHADAAAGCITRWRWLFFRRLSEKQKISDVADEHYLGGSLNGGTPKTPQVLIIFSRKANGCWVPPF